MEKAVLSAIAQEVPEGEIKVRFGAQLQAVEAMVRSAKILLRSDDDIAGRFNVFLASLESSDRYSARGEAKVEDAQGTGSSSISSQQDSQNVRFDGMGQTPRDRRLALLEQIESWSVDEMRDLGGSLLRLADALDQEWDPNQVTSSYRWPSEAARIEKNSIELAKVAILLRRKGKVREKYLPRDLIAEPVWEMLLELFVQFSGGALISTKSLVISSGAPSTTALRYIDRLEEEGLVERSQSYDDGRVTLVGLTQRGVIAVGKLLEKMR